MSYLKQILGELKVKIELQITKKARLADYCSGELSSAVDYVKKKGKIKVEMD